MGQFLGNHTLVVFGPKIQSDELLDSGTFPLEKLASNEGQVLKIVDNR